MSPLDDPTINFNFFRCFDFNKVTVKSFLYCNSAPHNEGVLGEWRYSSTHSLTSALAALPPEKEPLVPIG